MLHLLLCTVAASIAHAGAVRPGAADQVPAGLQSGGHVVPEPPPAVLEPLARAVPAAASVDPAGVVDVDGVEPERAAMASLVEIGEVSAKAAEEADQKARPEAGGAPANGQSEDSKQASAGIPKVDETAKVADANAVAKPDEKAATAAGKAPLSEPKAAALEGGTPPERGADSQNETSAAPATRVALSELGATTGKRRSRRHRHKRVRPSPKKKPETKSDEHHFHSLPPEEAHALMLARNARRKPPPHPEPIEFEEFTAKEVTSVKPEEAAGGLDVRSVTEWVRSHTPAVSSLLDDWWGPMKAPATTAQLVVWSAPVLVQVLFFVVIAAFLLDYFSRALAKGLGLPDASSTPEKPTSGSRAEAPTEEEQCEIDLR